jgi:hypothetical protein
MEKKGGRKKGAKVEGEVMLFISLFNYLRIPNSDFQS